MLLKDVSVGEKVLVYRNDRARGVSRVEAVAVVSEVFKTRCRIGGYGSFKLSTGERSDCLGLVYFRRATAVEIESVLSGLNARAVESERADEAAKKAAYDSLPEEVRLARKLEFFCNVNGEKTIARMPLEILRAAVAWVEENNLECE